MSRITLYSGLIAVSTVCFVLLSTDAHSSDAGLEHSTSHIHLSTHSLLFSSAVTVSLHCAVHAPLCIRNTLICCDTTVHPMLSTVLM